jgi:hypothetical protein
MTASEFVPQAFLINVNITSKVVVNAAPSSVVLWYRVAKHSASDFRSENGYPKRGRERRWNENGTNSAYDSLHYKCKL